MSASVKAVTMEVNDVGRDDGVGGSRVTIKAT